VDEGEKIRVSADGSQKREGERKGKIRNLLYFLIKIYLNVKTKIKNLSITNE